MSHLAESQIRAAFIRAEETLNSVIKRIEKLSLRPEVRQKILSDFGIDAAAGDLQSMGYSEVNFSKINSIRNRVGSFFAAMDTYIAYNFNLEVSDYNAALEKASEVFTMTGNNVTEIALASTNDELYKAYIRSASKEGVYKTSGELLSAAKEKMSKSGLYKSRAAQNLKRILKDQDVPKETDLSDASAINEAIKQANETVAEAEIDKAVRNRVLTAIIKIIKEQGFIVKKENVEEMGDYAKISVIKPNGEKAEFAVYLDGKFVYKFHEYEGMSCEKDIDNFEQKFESIYGVKIENKNITWSNPDRIGKMTRQTINAKYIGG
jgi:hypothetical protein